MTYTDFLKGKHFAVPDSGFSVSGTLNQMLFEWQNDVDRWALKKGKCALFEDCGLGKTPQQLVWAQEVCKHTGGNVLIIAPLAVAAQTQKEGVKFGVDVTVCRSQKDIKRGINVTNYEMLDHFKPTDFVGVVLDESSILKHHNSKTREVLTQGFKNTPYRLCCTATPAPNDFVELGNHAEFLGIMSRTEMLATFFVHDGGDTSKWRLKGHAESKFFEWVASWACCMTSPADLGCEKTGYDLPQLNITEHIVKSDDLCNEDGQEMFFASTSQSLMERRQARRSSLEDRCKLAADIANSTADQVIVWCDLNDESAMLAKLINGAVEVKGSDSNEHKTNSMMGFSDGSVKCLVSKPSIAGWGMNWQNCHEMIFVGLSDSFESYYQAVRRCWRFGQTNETNVHIVISDAEGAVKANIERKQADAQRMTSELTKYTKEILSAEIKSTKRITEPYYACEKMEVPRWLMSA